MSIVRITHRVRRHDAHVFATLHNQTSDLAWRKPTDWAILLRRTTPVGWWKSEELEIACSDWATRRRQSALDLVTEGAPPAHSATSYSASTFTRNV